MEVAGGERRPDRAHGVHVDVPEIGPPNIASRAIVPPIAIAAASPTARVSVATARITNMRKAVMTSSKKNDCASEPEERRADAGDVAEQGAQEEGREDGARELGRPVAEGAWPGKVALVSAKAKVTAPLKCAPEMCPTA